MKNNTTAIATFAFSFLLQGCCDEDKVRMFDFSAIAFQLSHPADSPIPSEANLQLNILLQTHEVFMSENTQNRCFQLLPSAHAMQECPYLNVLKYEITKLDIVSDAHFNDSYAAGDSLEELFPMPPSYFNVISLNFQERPTIDMEHQFTITLSKSDGTQVHGTAEPIIWEDISFDN